MKPRRTPGTPAHPYRGGGPLWRGIVAALLALVCLRLFAAADTPAQDVRESLRTQAQSLRLQASASAPAAAPSAMSMAVADFYERRDFQPAWIGHPDRRQAWRLALLDLRTDGLIPEHYGLAALEDPGLDEADRSDHLALREWALTEGYLRALLHLYRGKLDPHDLDAVWNVERRPLDVTHGLDLAVQALADGRFETLMQSARPQNPIYAELRRGLQGLRDLASAGGWPSLPEGPTLDPDQVDARVTLLRRRLALGGYALPPEDAQSERYDPALEAAVRSFQQDHYLDADGRVGRATRAVLNIPVETRIDQLRANLERARWLLHDLDGDFVLVDVAGFRVHYMRGGVPIFTSRVQVGQPLRRTPIFRADIESITLNPSWVVPPTILLNDIVPRLSRDPGYLKRTHLRAFDAQGREVDARRVDWTRPRGAILRQDAGRDGALGRIAIRFPNAYAVYLHETPHTALFSSAQRAFSSGCIRVEHPFELALWLFDGAPEWDQARFDAIVASGQTTQVALPRPVPILLMYWTVDLRPDGRVAFKPDLYQLDAAVVAALDHAPGPTGESGAAGAAP